MGYAKAQFEEAAAEYDQEYQDLLDSFEELQGAAKDYCDCIGKQSK
jgi:hypothetical protein